MSEEKFDLKCPYVKLMGEDLMRTTEAYFRCQANCRGREPGEFGEPTDYYKCDSENYLKCGWYLRENKLEEGVK
ncbi:hypothetical protein GW932_01850 [archaeon]|nr:hypothetical protein [archaeon]